MPIDGCRVYSGYIREVDDKPSATSWGPKMTFANLMAEHSNGGGKRLYIVVVFNTIRGYLAWHVARMLRA